MNVTEWIGRLLGDDLGRSGDVSRIDSVRLSFGAPWAHEGPAWVFFGCMALAVVAVIFYLRYQQRGRLRSRVPLALTRAALLCLLFVILADPIREIRYTSHPRPLMWVLFDGTESMEIADELPEDERQRLGSAVDLEPYWTKKQAALVSEGSQGTAGEGKPTRTDYVRALLERDENNLLAALSDKFRFKAYLLDRPDGVRALEAGDDDRIDPKALAAQLTTQGEVTALGSGFEDLALRHATSNLAGLLVVSDFDQNSGPVPLPAAKKLNVPVFTLGVGPRTAVDVAVDVQAPLTMKKAEQSTVTVTVRQQELDGRTVSVRVTAHPADTLRRDRLQGSVLVGEKDVTLERSTQPVEFPFTPEETGRYVFVAEVDPVEGEVNPDNNRAEREVSIIDDFLRLLYVEQEPTWEWRFVKEVFHRDRLVGMRGFRTFLRSSDPSVRETNELFVPSLTPPRSEFFENDVIFLGDYPGAQLSTRFCEMVKEFVGQFGGGLVIIAGPRFGPGELADTPLADMLPVVVDPDARLRDDREFQLTLTPYAEQYDFMQLGEDEAANRRAWKNLGRIPWYQPVRRVEPSATTVLAEHPTDFCSDGRTKQPLIAVRKYGRGEVVYLGFNEMWRLRRKYGEQYYRQFWGQMIHRLGLSHALGSQKRFVVRADRQEYRPDDKVLLTVEAYDRNFEPLAEEDVPDRALQAELVSPGRGPDGGLNLSPLRIAQAKAGLFETRLPVFEPGEYRVRVTDPLTDEVSEVPFKVASVSVERRSVVRNFAIQQNLAAETGGKAYELDTVSALLDDFQPARLTETTVEIRPLWSSWLWFGAVVTLMLGEWFFRKRVNLA